MTLPWKEATVCLLRRGGTTLFIDYTQYPHPIHEGFYAPPGGKVNNDETTANGARRELQEETGILGQSFISRGVVKFHNEQRTLRDKPFKYNFTVHIFDCPLFDDTAARLTEGAGLVWVKNDEILHAPLSPGDHILWQWLARYETIDGAITHVGEQVVAYHVRGSLPNGELEDVRLP